MSGLPLRSCALTRTGWLRQPRPLRPPPEPCPQGPTWRAKRDWPGRSGAPRAGRVARRSSAGRRTTRRNGSSAGSPRGIVGMEPARSWSTFPPLSYDLLPTLHQPETPPLSSPSSGAAEKGSSSMSSPRNQPIIPITRCSGGFTAYLGLFGDHLPPDRCLDPADHPLLGSGSSTVIGGVRPRIGRGPIDLWGISKRFI